MESLLNTVLLGQKGLKLLWQRSRNLLPSDERASGLKVWTTDGCGNFPECGAQIGAALVVQEYKAPL